METNACAQIRFEVVRHAQTCDARARALWTTKKQHKHTAGNFVIVNNTQMNDSAATPLEQKRDARKRSKHRLANRENSKQYWLTATMAAKKYLLGQ